MGCNGLCYGAQHGVKCSCNCTPTTKQQIKALRKQIRELEENERTVKRAEKKQKKKQARIEENQKISRDALIQLATEGKDERARVDAARQLQMSY